MSKFRGARAESRGIGAKGILTNLRPGKMPWLVTKQVYLGRIWELNLVGHLAHYLIGEIYNGATHSFYESSKNHN